MSISWAAALTTTDTARPAAAGRRPLSGYLSVVLPPALVLVAVLFLAGLRAELPPLDLLALVAGLGLVPGLIHKGTKGFFRRRGIADHWRTNLVSVLMLAGTAVCYLLPAGDPVPSTAAALTLGNAGLAFFRRWLNVSAHVSVLTFGVLWVIALYGSAWAWLLLLLPVMLLSRVSLREHTWKETLSGAAWGLGTFCCWLALYRGW